jgi:hypothetical protein
MLFGKRTHARSSGFSVNLLVILLSIFKHVINVSIKVAICKTNTLLTCVIYTKKSPLHESKGEIYQPSGRCLFA